MFASVGASLRPSRGRDVGTTLAITGLEPAEYSFCQPAWELGRSKVLVRDGVPSFIQQVKMGFPVDRCRIVDFQFIPEVNAEPTKVRSTPLLPRSCCTK
jgi:hypothetical protein